MEKEKQKQQKTNPRTYSIIDWIKYGLSKFYNLSVLHFNPSGGNSLRP